MSARAGITADLGLEVEEIRNENRALEVENAMTVRGVLDIEDDERFLWHSVDLRRQTRQ